MPESALNGLVEGLLQGNALKEKRKQDAYEKERQHATDIFQQHVQTWKEQQAQADAQRVAAQQTFDNKLATDQQAVREAEEKRKTAADEDRRKLAEGSATAKTDKDRATNYWKAIGLGYQPEQATMLSGYTPPVASSPPHQMGGGAGSALDILNSAGQNQRPLPGGASGGLVPPAIQSLMGTPPGTQMPPAATGPRATSPIGQAPAVASKIGAQTAKTNLDTAKIPLLSSKNLEQLAQVDYTKAKAALAQEQKKLTDAKIPLTHYQTERAKALAEIQPDLGKAQVNLANARAGAEIARIEYMHVQESHMKMMDALKSSEKDLGDYKKRGDILKQAKDAESKMTNERYAQEKALSKSEATMIAYENTAKIDPNTVEKPADKVAIQIAKEMLPKIQQDVLDGKARIAEITAREKEAHSYVVKSTDFINKDGVPDKKATTKEHTAADDLAADAAKASKEADKAATDAGLTIPGVGTLTAPKKHLPADAKKLAVPGLPKIKNPKAHPAAKKPVLSGEGFTLTPK